MIEIKTLATGSTGNCYMIDDGRTQLLIECGISFKSIQKALDFKTSNIAGVLVSHEHKDHCKAIKDVADRGLDIYMSQGTADAIGIVHHRIRLIECKKTLKLGTWTILPFDVQHDAAEPFGFLIANDAGDKLLFATDTYYIKYKFSGLTHLMIECNYSQKILEENVEIGRTPEFLKYRVMKSHFSLENLLIFLKANDLSKVQEIHLLHLSDSNSNEQEFKQAVQAATGKLVYVP
ncbi:metallo-beta-lactamase domain protein [Sporosarcina newyorkensis 2681]|uniref:Metallo-beta-lactamase domain protein n=1 Tax=Sporosarcina newyorkensis 2681 TaxID=1027292 RepID=F9DX63_9BACL|nr:MBL fold metallo-hydrolase [Sporosarcina newyorkensis]EGQ21111.1 metallo-beta-lactamase domain protein [Sporosarcina newyorkensis 2681]